MNSTDRITAANSVDVLLKTTRIDWRPVSGLHFAAKGEQGLDLSKPLPKQPGLALRAHTRKFQALLDHKDLPVQETQRGDKATTSSLDANENSKGERVDHGELIAEIAAMEALFPYRERMQIFKTGKR